MHAVVGWIVGLLFCCRFLCPCLFTDLACLVISVVCRTEGAVVNAMNMVKKTIEAASARATEKQDYTHFISVPLNMPEVKEKVASFMQKAMDTGAKGMA